MRCTLAVLLATLAFGQQPELIPSAEGLPPGTEAFTQQRLALRSTILGETRRVIVALPPSFVRTPATRRYPVGIVFDGDYVLSRLIVSAAELIRQGQMPEMVLVGIENAGGMEGRLRDLTPPGLSVSGSSLNEGGDRFLDFLERELLPALDRQFRTGQPRMLVGHSSGGILATWAAATRSEFRLILALDTPVHLGQDWLPKKLTARAASGSAPPLRFAAFGARFPWTDDQWKRLNAAAPATWSLHYQKLDHETHNSMLMLSTYLGLRRLFEPYSKLSAPEFPTTKILPYYSELRQQFGAELDPPQALLRDVLEDLLAEGRGAQARAALNQLTAAYGAPADSVDLARTVADVERRPPPSETVESLLATPMPAASEVQHLVGEWEGETWMNPEDRSPFTLRIRIENGRATGEVIQHPAPGEEQVRKLQYLSVQKDGFTWGMMNGMRPRGMLLWEVRGNPEKMEGKLRWGGISFRMEDGSAPPAILVRVRKVK